MVLLSFSHFCHSFMIGSLRLNRLFIRKAFESQAFGLRDAEGGEDTEEHEKSIDLENMV